ncbi:MAG: hypothetical protein ACRCVX_00610, partial [Shewanella sp.]
RSLRVVIDSLLRVAGIATGLEVGASDPMVTINYPQQKKAGESFVDQAGEMAMLGGGYIWADGQRRIKFDLAANPSLPTLTLSPRSVAGYERIDSQDHAEPYEELRLVATKTTVVPISYPNKLDPQETYKTLKEIFPDKALYFTLDNPLVLVEGSYAVEDWDGVSVRTIISKTDFLSKVIFSTITGIGETGYRMERSQGEVIEKFYYHAKPPGWNSCRLEENPKGSAGLIRKYEKTFPKTGYRHTIDYTYDSRQNLIRRLEIKITPLTPDPSFLGRPTTPGVPPSDAGYWEEDVRWVEDFPGSNRWSKTVKVKAPGGNLNNTFDTNNGTPNLAIIDAPPKIDSDSPPEQAPTAPTGFTTVDEQIEVIVRAPGRDGGLAVKAKPVSVKAALSEAQLKTYGELIVAISWGRAYGRRVEIPLYDALLSAGYKPLQRWDYEDGVSKIALRVAEPAILLTQDRCMVGVEAGKIGDINPDGTVTTPFALIYDAGAIYDVVGGVAVSWPPQPPIVVDSTYDILGGEPPLRWSALTQEQWYNLSQPQWARMLQ